MTIHLIARFRKATTLEKSMNKVCPSCGIEKQVANFYRKGTYFECKSCSKKRTMSWRIKNLIKWKSYMKAYRIKNHIRICQMESKYRRNKLRCDPIARMKHLARVAVKNALRDKRLIKKKCEIENCRQNSEAHHDNHKRQLDVRWLCRVHHMELHQ